MASESNDEIVIRNRGSRPARNEETAQNTENNVNETQDNAVEQAPQQPQPQESVWKTILTRMFVFWLITQFFKSRQSSTNQPSANASSLNIFPVGTSVDLWVYLSSEQEIFDDKTKADDKKLIWFLKELSVGNWTSGPNKDGSHTTHYQVKTTTEVQNNGSLYLHAFITKSGSSPNPHQAGYKRQDVIGKTRLMTVYRKRRIHKTKNLLTGEAEIQSDAKAGDKHTPIELISYWHPNLTINLLDDQTQWTKGSVPAPLDEVIEFDNETGGYYPVLYMNDYWNYFSDYMPVNETTKVLDLYLTYAPLSLFKWQMYESQRMRKKWFAALGDEFEDSEEDQDSMKKTMAETSPYLLGLTIIVSLVHSVFEFLAFKNDIQFWRSRKSLEGLSVRSVFFNVFQSVIVLLYVWDNEANTIVIISCFVGLIIEIWKIHKVVDVTYDRENLILGFIPRIKFADKQSYTESSTRQYDTLAFKYLSWLLFPLLFAYSVYSLFYQEHKGWYSWVLNMLYGFLLTFGFIMMTPQLFINYKMKSVAHLPWRMLTYKALNTFIDDLFAFIIKMPTLYRLGCLRDDVIFFIYLYQKWIYPIDYKRVNEFGVSGEDLQQADSNGVLAKTDEAQPDGIENENSRNGEVQGLAHEKSE
ncbi:cleft lip and palate transmembrane protein 1 homolog [Dendronephthya gigantea]|uniref:cleft lip and palate transmembrane protein 1 homolog n=1 Tax=Dendronephthya gigantea TaxID=151771 RepID=UPI00106D968B|nr:cleft lip and palate transmembrane protein 1 homolog [Dendronephthya gigantea]